VNVELRPLVRTMREANLWTRHLEDNFKRLAEPESDLGRALTMEELERLEAVAASNPAWEVALCVQQLAANTGLRGCEIKRIRIGNVNLEDRRLEIKREGTKTNAGARRIELNQSALSTVNEIVCARSITRRKRSRALSVARRFEPTHKDRGSTPRWTWV
jgi:integrase